MSRPMLLPGLAVLWRGPHTLQLGLDPLRAVVLDLPNPAAAGVLDLLDGTRTEIGVIAAAVRRGIGDSDARALLDVLRRQALVVGARTLLPSSLAGPARDRMAAEAAALALRGGEAPGTPAQILRRRAAARVRVAGRGRLGIPIAVALAAAGVGHVDPALEGTVEPGELILAGTSGTPPETAVTSRATVATSAIATVAPGVRVTALQRRETTFLVQVGPPPRPASLHALAYRSVAHLVAAVRDGAIVIGPLVPPGDGPCLYCVDLHRTDRDRAWPGLASQLATSVVLEACGVAALSTAVGYVAGEVLRFLDGATPDTVGATIEVIGPGRIRRRVWPPHPACDCIRRRRSRRDGAAATG